MDKRREIDSRDLDVLLRALTDRQIADLYGMSVEEVRLLRIKRWRQGTADRRRSDLRQEAKDC